MAYPLKHTLKISILLIKPDFFSICSRFLLIFKIFNWRIIPLQYCVGFCHTLTWNHSDFKWLLFSTSCWVEWFSLSLLHMHGCAYACAYENYRERHITMDCYLITVWLLLLVWLCGYGQCFIQDFYTIIKWACTLPLAEVQVLRTLNHFPKISVPISKTVLWGVSCPSKEEGWGDGPTWESRTWQPWAQLSLQCVHAW